VITVGSKNKPSFKFVTVEGFDNEEEAIALANDSIYGLAGAVFSKDIGIESLASAIASSSLSNPSTVTTGPNTSS
jgi:hypothetical protein